MRTILFIFLLLNLNFLKAQNEFPAAWTGKYKGDMILLNYGNRTDTAQVELDIHELVKDSAWSYTMTYRSKRWGTLTKDYAIRRGTEENYFMDEKNGLIIEMNLMDGCFYEMFEVSGMFFHVTMRKHRRDIVFELTGIPSEPTKTTELSDEEDPEGKYIVNSYFPTVVQKVYLKRSRK